MTKEQLEELAAARASRGAAWLDKRAGSAHSSPIRETVS